MSIIVGQYGNYAIRQFCADASDGRIYELTCDGISIEDSEVGIGGSYTLNEARQVARQCKAFDERNGGQGRH